MYTIDLSHSQVYHRLPSQLTVLDTRRIAAKSLGAERFDVLAEHLLVLTLANASTERWNPLALHDS